MQRLRLGIDNLIFLAEGPEQRRDTRRHFILGRGHDRCRRTGSGRTGLAQR
jgi:hypothetical protein